MQGRRTTLNKHRCTTSHPHFYFFVGSLPYWVRDGYHCVGVLEDEVLEEGVEL